MENLLISRCLLGDKVRYDGGHCLISTKELSCLKEKFRLVAICPEVMAGMGVPRIPIELLGNRVVRQDGVDVTAQFHTVIEEISKLVQEKRISYALFKDESPSCGSKVIYDGSFSGVKVEGEGIITQVLRQNGVVVFSENDIKKLLNQIK